MDKRTTVTTAFANVHCAGAPFLVERKKGFVRFTIQATSGEGLEEGVKLYLFDSRSLTFEAAMLCVANGGHAPDAKKALAEAIMQPAKVVVMMRTIEGEKTYFYVNLFPIDDGQVPTTLFSVTPHLGKRDGVGFGFPENKGLWSWESRSSPRSGFELALLVALTDEDHPIIARSYDYTKGGNKAIVTVISDKVVSMPEEVLELAATAVGS